MTDLSQSNSRRVALVGCGKAKLDHSAPARELYTSNLFRLSAAWAERFCDGWYVVSAQHGLVEPDRVLAPYDFSLRELREAELDAWSHRVVSQLRQHEEDGAEFVVLAGGRYERLTRTLEWTTVPGVNFCRGLVASVEDPLTGFQIGERLQWLKRELEAVAA